MGLSIHFFSTKIVNSKRKGDEIFGADGDTSVTGSVGWMIRKLSIRTK